jgi:hypothetical protein
MLAVSLLAQDRPGLFFREDWKETPPETPVTQAHVANPELVLSLYGPGKSGIKKSHHDKPADDPYYIWMGECPANCALSLRHKSGFVDLTGQAKIRWRSKQSGFHALRIILKLADGTWLIADQSDGPSEDWRCASSTSPISDGGVWISRRWLKAPGSIGRTCREWLRSAGPT